MKIGFFTDTYFPQINGVTYTVNLWKRELEKLGHEVFVYYPRDNKYEPAEREVPLRSLPFFFYKGYNIGLPSFKKVEKDFDIIHLHGFVSMAPFGMAVARKQEIPCVLTYHTPPDQYLEHLSSNEFIQESLRLLYMKYERELLERCQLVTAPSKDVIEMLKERWGDKISKTMYFTNGIDMDLFREVNSEAFKKEFGIPDGRVVGYTGRHSSEKRVDEVIKFAKDFDGTVVLSGGGQQHDEYVEMAKGLDNVKFLGFLPRERLPEFYSCLDLFIMPSTVETEGLVVLEANACGTPAIGADAMALKNTIKEGVNGYRYRPGDVEDLKDKLELAYKNLNELKRSSKERAQERSVALTAKKLVGIYEKLKDEGVSVSGRK